MCMRPLLDIYVHFDRYNRRIRSYFINRDMIRDVRVCLISVGTQVLVMKVYSTLPHNENFLTKLKELYILNILSEETCGQIPPS